MSVTLPDGPDERMIRRQNLAKGRRVIVDKTTDLKTQETLDPALQQHFTEVLKDRQMRDWEKRLCAIEEYRKNPKRAEWSQASPSITNEKPVSSRPLS